MNVVKFKKMQELTLSDLIALHKYLTEKRKVYENAQYGNKVNAINDVLCEVQYEIHKRINSVFQELGLDY